MPSKGTFGSSKWIRSIKFMVNAKRGSSTPQVSCDLDMHKNTVRRIATQARKAAT